MAALRGRTLRLVECLVRLTTEVTRTLATTQRALRTAGARGIRGMTWHTDTEAVHSVTWQEVHRRGIRRPGIVVHRGLVGGDPRTAATGVVCQTSSATVHTRRRERVVGGSGRNTTHTAVALRPGASEGIAVVATARGVVGSGMPRPHRAPPQAPLPPAYACSGPLGVEVVSHSARHRCTCTNLFQKALLVLSTPVSLEAGVRGVAHHRHISTAPGRATRH